MNETSIHGNVTATPELSFGPNGKAFARFTVAVNRGYFDRQRNKRIEQPTVFHQVVVFGTLAENAAASLTKGTTVTVTGEIEDDSYTPDGSDKPIRRHRVKAFDIAVSLRWATAEVAKNTRDTDAREADAA